MDINDFEIIIKKYHQKKNCVIINLLILRIIEIRGFTVRYTPTKHSSGNSVWIANPPGLRGRGGHWFWIARILDSALWQKLEERMIKKARDYANSLS